MLKGPERDSFKAQQTKAGSVIHLTAQHLKHVAKTAPEGLQDKSLTVHEGPKPRLKLHTYCICGETHSQLHMLSIQADSSGEDLPERIE